MKMFPEEKQASRLRLLAVVVVGVVKMSIGYLVRLAPFRWSYVYTWVEAAGRDSGQQFYQI